MRALMLAGLLLAATVAGCLAGDEDEDDPLEGAPFTFFLCRDGVRAAAGSEAAPRVPDGRDACNHRVTLPLRDSAAFDWTGQHGPANEASIAVDPDDPMRVIAGAKDYTVSYISDVADCGEYTVWMGTYWSSDGGVTWGNDLMPGFVGDDRPSPLAGNLCNTDPVVAWDDGAAWFHALNYAGTRDDAPLPVPSPFGSGDLVTGSQLFFARSFDGGATYDGADITFASLGDDGLIFNDKNWFALQPGGDHAMATWSNFISPAGLPVPVGGPVIMFTESFDDGRSWSAPQPIPGSTASNFRNVQFSMPHYLPGGGSVAVIWADFGTYPQPLGSGAYVAYTEGVVTPGGTVFRPAEAAFPFNPLKSGSGRDGTGPSAFRLSTYPVLAVDTSGGACDGRRYVVWSDQPGGLDSDVDVLLRWSDDGAAWSEPITVNDVPDGDQLMPWIDVDPDGGVHVVFYDRRHDPQNRLLDVTYAYSGPCGETWQPNVRVTETSFDGDLGHHQSGAPFIGDYIGVDASAVSAHVIWADTRHTGEPGRQAGSDVYSATLLREPRAFS